MFKLWIQRTRIFNYKVENQDQLIGEYATLNECEAARGFTWALHAYVIGPNGERYEEIETENEDDPDYVNLHFQLVE